MDRVVCNSLSPAKQNTQSTQILISKLLPEFLISQQITGSWALGPRPLQRGAVLTYLGWWALGLSTAVLSDSRFVLTVNV